MAMQMELQAQYVSHLGNYGKNMGILQSLIKEKELKESMTPPEDIHIKTVNFDGKEGEFTIKRSLLMKYKDSFMPNFLLNCWSPHNPNEVIRMDRDPDSIRAVIQYMESDGNMTFDMTDFEEKLKEAEVRYWLKKDNQNSGTN
jgi:hypothetical protein